jgi:hypothetical protein
MTLAGRILLKPNLKHPSPLFTGLSGVFQVLPMPLKNSYKDGLQPL